MIGQMQKGGWEQKEAVENEQGNSNKKCTSSLTQTHTTPTRCMLSRAHDEEASALPVHCSLLCSFPFRCWEKKKAKHLHSTTSAVTTHAHKKAKHPHQHKTTQNHTKHSPSTCRRGKQDRLTPVLTNNFFGFCSLSFCMPCMLMTRFCKDTSQKSERRVRSCTCTRTWGL